MFNLRLSFLLRNFIVYKIQCKLSFPKLTRNISGLLRNARQVPIETMLVANLSEVAFSIFFRFPLCQSALLRTSECHNLLCNPYRDLKANQIETIEDGAFNDLTQLQSL